MLTPAVLCLFPLLGFPMDGSVILSHVYDDSLAKEPKKYQGRVRSTLMLKYPFTLLGPLHPYRHPYSTPVAGNVNPGPTEPPPRPTYSVLGTIVTDKGRGASTSRTGVVLYTRCRPLGVSQDGAPRVRESEGVETRGRPPPPNETPSPPGHTDWQRDGGRSRRAPASESGRSVRRL